MFALLPMLAVAALGVLGMLGFGFGLKNYTNGRLKFRKASRTPDGANIDVGHALGLAVLVAVIIVGAVVALQVLASLFPVYSGAVSNLSSNMSTANWGNATANSLGPIFGLLISLAGIFAVLGLAFLAFAFYKGGSLFGGRGGA